VEGSSRLRDEGEGKGTNLVKSLGRVVNESFDPVLIGRHGLELCESETDGEGVLWLYGDEKWSARRRRRKTRP